MFRLKIIKMVLNHHAKSIKQGHIYYSNYYRRLSTETNPNKWLNTETPQKATESEQDFFVRIKNDPDLFGGPSEKTLIDEGDLREQKYSEERPTRSKKLTTKQYADIIKDLIARRKLKEALDVLETRMLQEDRVKPENYIYNLLLGACGSVGYTKKAFSLYNQMKKRGLQPTGGTYTALFNACANSPWPQDGLARAHHLRNIMIEKLYEPNDTNYNVMIKAFGRCGDLPTAFSLADEMFSKRLPIRDDTMNFLLQACINDKEAGFRHALLIWRKMTTKHIKPSMFTYNLLLRTIRDCGIGDLEVMQATLDTILDKKLSGGKSTKLLLLASENNQLVATVSTPTDLTPVVNSIGVETDGLRPNLMAKVPHLGNIVSIAEIKRPEDRLLLVGAAKGFLRNMEEFGCSPDVRTFTLLLDCLPGSVAAEKELLGAMKQAKVKPDLDFFNMLIKKRSMRADYENAREVLKMIRKSGLLPDLITYGVLALGCKTKEEALDLIQEMDSHSYRLNTQILGAMLKQACYHKNFPYVLEIMQIAVREDIPPNKKFLDHLAQFKAHCKQISNDSESKLSQMPSFQIGYKNFKMRYTTWLKEINVDEAEEVHPWQQFRLNSETNTKHMAKDSTTKFKARHTSQFRVKTSPKWRTKDK